MNNSFEIVNKTIQEITNGLLLVLEDKTMAGNQKIKVVTHLIKETQTSVQKILSEVYYV